MEIIKNLQESDIPEEWKSTVATRETETLIVKTYSRGGVKLLTVGWPKKGSDAQQTMATLYHDQIELATIMINKDRATVTPSRNKKTEAYMVSSELRKDGQFSVLVNNLDGSFMEWVIVNGRDTSLLNDLQYAKMVLSTAGLKPLMDSMRDEAKERAKDPKKPE